MRSAVNLRNSAAYSQNFARGRSPTGTSATTKLKLDASVCRRFWKALAVGSLSLAAAAAAATVATDECSAAMVHVWCGTRAVTGARSSEGLDACFHVPDATAKLPCVASASAAQWAWVNASRAHAQWAWVNASRAHAQRGVRESSVTDATPRLHDMSYHAAKHTQYSSLYLAPTRCAVASQLYTRLGTAI